MPDLDMPKIFKHNHNLMQLQSEVKHLEMALNEHIRSKQNMTSTALKNTKLTKAQLQQTPVAIVGMASVFPQSHNLQEYWQKIVGKKDCITDVPSNRWNIDEYYDPDPTAPDKTYCKRGGFIPEVDFNPMEFGIPPNQLEATDISQLLALLVAKEALLDAGCGDNFDKEHTGVILGAALAKQLTMPLAARLQYPIWEKALKSSGVADADIETIINKIKNSYIDWTPNAFPGMLANVVAGRIANRFDLGGMNCVVDAACASSFGALSMAIAELTSGRANMMLTGGVDTDNSIMAYMCFSKTPAVSPSETSKPFDVNSDGMMLGEGVGMLVLKRLADAERDGDRIYAVIKGIGTSSDGRHKSIYAPRPKGQMRALRRAYEEAGFEPTTVGMIEAHGTGTMAGDPAEFAALKGVFGEDKDSKEQIALGSVKSQIGHTKAAAGAASLIKTALALHHKILPPTINITKPNPKLEIEDSPFYLNTETRPWLKSGSVPRRAGVSSFGFGGTNYHIVLEEHQPEQQDVYRLHNTPQAILIDAPTPKKLLHRCEDILQQLQSATKTSCFKELAKESKTKQIPIEAARLGFVAASIDEVSNKLQKAIATMSRQSESSHWEHPLGIFYRQTGMATEGKVVALFSGQGSQYPEMGRELAINFPTLRETYARIDRLLEREGLAPVSQAVFPAPVFDEAQREEQVKNLQQTEIAQSAIAAFSTGLYKILQQAGFKADFVAGHSFGELTALWAAGVLQDEDYFFLVKERGQAMSGAKEAGAMLAVRGNTEQIRAAIAKFNVAIANCNSPQQIVLAGDKAEIALVQTALEQQGYSAVILPVSAAFHTPLVSHAQTPFSQAVDAVTFNPPRVPVFTNVSGNPYPQEPQQCQKILKKHLLSQVLFQEEIENIYQGGGTCFVEFGPRSILTHLVKETLGDRPHLAVALNPSRQKDSDRSLREAVVQLKVAGLSLTDFDPYQIVPTESQAKHPLNVSLTSVNYVSEKTKQLMKQALETGGGGSPRRLKDARVRLPRGDGETGRRGDWEKSKSDPSKDNLTVAKAVSYDQPAIKSWQNGGHSKLSTMNEVSMTHAHKPQPSSSVEIPLERILSSLEYSLAQFQQHQQETLEVHRQYLHYQSQYAQNFFGLMQQQQQLWTTVQSSPQATEVKTAVIASAERTMLQFQKHQGETLKVHEHYLNHQAKYVQNFFLLTQQSYAQFLAGNYKLAATSNDVSIDTKIDESEITGRSSAWGNSRLTPTEVMPLSQAFPTRADSVIDESITTSASSNGHGQYTIPEVDKASLNGNGHHFPSDSIKTEAIENNEHHSVTTLNKVNGNERDRALVDKAASSASIATTDLPEIDLATLSETLLNVVSDKTGYPPEMLELDMDMEADLGIDSIKRVEILGGLQEEMPNLPQPNLEDLGELRTLNQIIDYLRTYDLKKEKIEAKAVETESATKIETKPDNAGEIFLNIISEHTGYPVQNLDLEMSMQEDLGIGAVKRGEIFKSLQEQIPELLQTPEIAKLDTLTQIIDYLNFDRPQKKTPNQVTLQ